jgi:hypothetical protein
MATVVRFVSGPFAGQAEATDHRFRSAASQWRNHGGNGLSGLPRAVGLVRDSEPFFDARFSCRELKRFVGIAPTRSLAAQIL